MRGVRVAMVVVLVSAMAACDGTPAPAPTEPAPSTPSVAGSPGEFVAPPLQLPSVAADADCPIAAPAPWSDPEQAIRVLGPGPLYPVADYLPNDAVPLRDSYLNQDGSYTAKVRWLASGYTGPVLVRAGRIDGPGSASVEFSYLGESRDGGHHAVLSRPYNDLPATTTVSGPGCYAYQVDGTSFSYTIVFRAAPAAS